MTAEVGEVQQHVALKRGLEAQLLGVRVGLHLYTHSRYCVQIRASYDPSVSQLIFTVTEKAFLVESVY